MFFYKKIKNYVNIFNNIFLHAISLIDSNKYIHSHKYLVKIFKKEKKNVKPYWVKQTKRP